MDLRAETPRIGKTVCNLMCGVSFLFALGSIHPPCLFRRQGVFPFYKRVYLSMFVHMMEREWDKGDDTL